MRDDDEVEIIPDVVHVPITPPRASHHGEIVFVEQWQALMQKCSGYPSEDCANHMLCMVLGWREDEITQRAASVAVTFIKWLGTNCGAAFIETANRFQGEYPGGDHGYRMAWAVENERKSWMNSGFRAIEHILSADTDTLNGQTVWRPDLSVSDYEVVENVACWLSSTEGREFVAKCKIEIKSRILAERISDAVAVKDFCRVKFLMREFEVAACETP